MPVYKGNNEVTSGNLHKGSTEIQNGYKATDQFYVNTLAITINFVDAITNASMSTTQFQSVGTPGASFSSFTRTITTSSGYIFNGAVTVAETGDSGNNVTASISGQGSTTATLNVSGTYPSTGVTVTLTVNGATQLQLPNLNVTANLSSGVFSTSDSSALNTFNYSTSQSASGGGTCSGGTGNTSGTLSSGSSSYTWSSFSAGYAAGGTYGNGCGVTCTSTVNASKSGYNSGSSSYNQVGTYPAASYTCYVTASNFTSQQASVTVTSPSCVDSTPATYGSAINPSGTCSLTSTVSFGQANSVCNNGFSCTGTVSGTCPSNTVPKNSSSTVSSTGSCEARNYTSKNVTGSASLSLNSEGSLYFNLNSSGSAVITTNNDTATIVGFYVSTVCTNGRGGSRTETDYITGSNGINPNVTLSENQNWTSSGWSGPSPGFQTGDSINCTASYTATGSKYTTKSLGSSSFGFTKS